MDILQWLQTWFAQNCVDDWQHFYGIKIETLDNPGWHIDIDLSSTQVENKPFQEIYQDFENDMSWLHCKVTNKIFSAACSPNNLVTVLEIFKSWIEE